MAESLITVEVVFAAADLQLHQILQVPLGATIRQVIDISGVAQQIPHFDLTHMKVGIFSQALDLDSIVQEADRIEIYRPLFQDPKEARRMRAQGVKRPKPR